MQILEPLLRWVHVLFGILWVGGGYYFTLVQVQVGKAIGEERNRGILPQVLPRSIWWGRTAAIWSWVTGILLLGLVFHHAKLVFESGYGWGPAGGIVSLLALFGFVLYDLLAKSPLSRNGRLFGILGFVLIAVFILMMDKWAHFSYRSVNIHLGVLFGTIMAFNMIFRISVMHRRVLASAKGGQAPDPNLMAQVSARSRHNFNLSIPLIWTMLGAHTAAFAGGRLGIPSEYSFVVLLVVILIGWHMAFHLMRRAEKIKAN